MRLGFSFDHRRQRFPHHCSECNDLSGAQAAPVISTLLQDIASPEPSDRQDPRLETVLMTRITLIFTNRLSAIGQVVRLIRRPFLLGYPTWICFKCTCTPITKSQTLVRIQGDGAVGSLLKAPRKTLRALSCLRFNEQLLPSYSSA
jgi:hypothetical protein